MIKRCKKGNCNGCVFEETVQTMCESLKVCSVELCLNKEYHHSHFEKYDDSDDTVLRLQCPYYYAKKSLVNDVIECMNNDM